MLRKLFPSTYKNTYLNTMKTIQTSTMKNWSFKRKGKIMGNARLCLLSGTNQQKQRLWGPKTTPKGWSQSRKPVGARQRPPKDIRVGSRNQDGNCDHLTA